MIYLIDDFHKLNNIKEYIHNNKFIALHLWSDLKQKL